MTIRLVRGLLLLLSLNIFSTAQNPPPAFDGAEQWKNALLGSNMTSLTSLYSTSPAARFVGPDRKPAADIAPETDFWQKQFSSGATAFEPQIVGEKDQQGLHLVSWQIAMKVKTADGLRTRYVDEQQVWQHQGNQWRIVLAAHSDVLKMRPAPNPNPNLYDQDADARVEIREALAKAEKGHRRVILVFGANWCYDCHVLDQAFHQADIAPLLEKSFQVVHVDIGDDGKKNSDLAAQYKVPLNKGVPALAILDWDGKLLYSQQNGEWESARSMDPDDIILFLNKWKP